VFRALTVTGTGGDAQL